jgi:hypothetical protein
MWFESIVNRLRSLVDSLFGGASKVTPVPASTRNIPAKLVRQPPLG